MPILETLAIILWLRSLLHAKILCMQRIAYKYINRIIDGGMTFAPPTFFAQVSCARIQSVHRTVPLLQIWISRLEFFRSDMTKETFWSPFHLMVKDKWVDYYCKPLPFLRYRWFQNMLSHYPKSLFVWTLWFFFFSTAWRVVEGSL